MKLFLVIIMGLFLAINAVQGKRDYHESCSIGATLIKTLSPFKTDNSNICNAGKGLVCSPFGKCICAPLIAVYQESFLGSIGLGKIGGSCALVAERAPCVDSAICVRNSVCRGHPIPTCQCNEGYKVDNDGFCSSGSNFAPSIFGIVLLTLVIKILN